MDKPRQDQLAHVDQQIMDLLAQRIQIAGALPDKTQSTFCPVELAAQVRQLVQVGKDSKLGTIVPAEVIRIIATTIAGATSTVHDGRTTVAYLGPPLSYSYLATSRYFSESATLIPVNTISAVFDDVLASRTDFGVVPIENSTDGRVIDTLSTFADSPLSITGEVLLPIHHCLLSQSELTNIKQVYSKPQALSQCRKWLAMHLPSAKAVECSSTSAAAELACADKSVAAIASYEAGIHYGLNITARNIEDSRNNVTRFAVIGRGEPAPTGNDKTSLMFQIPHRAGALADAMVTFQKYSINLTWIESFPIRGNPNEYLFFVELEGHKRTQNIADAITALGSHTIRLECLGSYPKAVPVN